MSQTLEERIEEYKAYAGQFSDPMIRQTIFDMFFYDLVDALRNIPDEAVHGRSHLPERD